jgi:septum formation protein
VGLPVGCANAGPTQWSALSESWVTFAELSERAIRAYVDTGEPMGKAGAYAIQGLAALWVPRIQGSYSGIMGLPAFETASVLRSAGVELVGHDHGT